MLHEYSCALLHVVHHLIYQLCADGQGPQPWSQLLTFSHGKSPPMLARACGTIPPHCGNLPRRKYGICFSPADTTVGSSTRTGRRKAPGERARQRAGSATPVIPSAETRKNAEKRQIFHPDVCGYLPRALQQYSEVLKTSEPINKSDLEKSPRTCRDPSSPWRTSHQPDYCSRHN